MENNRKVRMSLEIEMDEYTRETLAISRNTDVLGGNIVRLDWEGGVFDEVDVYRKLFDELPNNLMCVLFDNSGDADLIYELQYAIKRVATPILRDKLKEKSKETESVRQENA